MLYSRYLGSRNNHDLFCNARDMITDVGFLERWNQCITVCVVFELVVCDKNKDIHCLGGIANPIWCGGIYICSPFWNGHVT